MLPSHRPGPVSPTAAPDARRVPDGGDSTTATDDQRPPFRTLRRARPLLGTLVEITAEGPEGAALERAADAAFEAIARVHRLMSLHADDSDLARMNRSAHRRPVSVDAWTHAVLRVARRVHAWTAGRFDCAVGTHLLGRHTGAVGASMAAVMLLDDDRVSYLEPLVLDLGGIAKGYAVDRAVGVLRRAGIASGMVNAGGDLRAFGHVPRPVSLRDPLQPARRVHAGWLREGALASSGGYLDAGRMEDGRILTAVVDPATGRRLGAAGSYTVLAPTCMLADALTKALALDENVHAPYLRRCGARALVLH